MAAAVQQHTQQRQGKICYGDCFECGYQQAWLCTGNNSLKTMRMVESLVNGMAALRREIEELKAKLGSEPEHPAVMEDAADAADTVAETATKGKKK